MALPVAEIGRIDVQVEAILVRRSASRRGSLLWAVVGEVGGVERTPPPRMRLGGPPGQVADGPRGIWNPEPLLHRGSFEAPDGTTVCGDDALRRSRRGQAAEDDRQRRDQADGQ